MATVGSARSMQVIIIICPTWVELILRACDASWVISTQGTLVLREMG